MFDLVHRIVCEHPQEKMWDTFLYLENEPAAKKFLEHLYAKRGFAESGKYAFFNTHKLIYFLKQAKQYYRAAQKSDILIRPLLLYYGMMSFVKAVVLTYDPNYPHDAKVMRHGISTRKLKRANYEFSADAVRMQKDGLLPLFCKHVAGKSCEEKFTVKEMLAQLPELHEVYGNLYGEEKLVPVAVLPRSAGSTFTVLELPERALDSVHLTAPAFVAFLNRYNRHDAYFKEHPAENPQIKPEGGTILLAWHHPRHAHVDDGAEGFENDLFLADYKGKHYLRLDGRPKQLLPEVCIHYMLMYNLGMLCRYETELWGEMIFSFASSDVYIINEFLTLSLRKFPNLILDLLFGARFLFTVG
ncbi:YaaC family protein [Bacillaceae bacterium]